MPLIITIIFSSCSKNVLSENISIIDGENVYKLSETKYIFLEDENFDIRINGLKTNQRIDLFAYYNDAYINKYN